MRALAHMHIGRAIILERVYGASGDISRPLHPDTTCACPYARTHSLPLSHHTRTAHTYLVNTHTHTPDRARTHAHEDGNGPAHAPTHTHARARAVTQHANTTTATPGGMYTRDPTVATPLPGPPPSSHLGPHRSSHAQTTHKCTHLGSTLVARVPTSTSCRVGGGRGIRGCATATAGHCSDL
jgi:hypothetical protein